MFDLKNVYHTLIIHYLFELTISMLCDSKPDMKGISTQVKISNAHKYYYIPFCVLFPFFFSLLLELFWQRLAGHTVLLCERSRGEVIPPDLEFQR